MFIKKKFEHPHQRLERRGFALVVTLSLMVLLTVVAVGLLSLSAISLRSSSLSGSGNTARANARVALMLALGELQKTAGPDQRITATGSILGETAAHPHLTGAWKSWQIQPMSPPTASDYARTQGKKAKFEGWLVSHANPDTVRTDENFALNGPLGDPLTLLSRRVLGTNATVRDEVQAGRVPIRGSAASSPVTGSLGWVVLDEAVKARVNLGEKLQNSSIGLTSLGLGTGQRPPVEHLSGLEKLDEEIFDLGSAASDPEIEKLVSLPTLEFLTGKFREKNTPRFHDLTTHSLGLLTDTARGGLRRDFSLLAENTTLPAAYLNKGVYATELGLSLPSDPRWQQLTEYARLFKSSRVANTGGRPSIRMHAPNGWPTSGGLQTPPPGMVVAPVVAKVQMVFTILARDIYRDYGPAGAIIPENSPTMHWPWGDNFRNSSYDYVLHLLYTPVVTLWNPYNVELQCENLRVEFKNVPFALKVFRNGVAQTTGFAPLDQMYNNSEQGNRDKLFGMNLKDKNAAGLPGSATIRLQPGEVKFFSPYIDPNRTWLQDKNWWTADNRSVFQDAEVVNGVTNLTQTIDGIPGWRGDGIGFDLDWFAPAPIRVTHNETENGKNMYRGGVIGLRRNDLIHLEYVPRSISQSNNKFTVRLVDSGNTSKILSVMEMDYEKPAGLQEQMLGSGGSIRFPEQGGYTTLQLLDGHKTPIKDYVNPKNFAILSAYAKTTYGGLDSSTEDGRYATKPWVFNNPASPVVAQKVVSEHPAHHSHEIDLTPLDGDTDEFIDVGANDRGSFITGHTVFNGRNSGTHSEIPLAPLQTLTALNGANLTASGRLPRFNQPLGNSLAHPVMSSGQIVEMTTPSNYPYADHSFLLNLALYDGWFCSGLQDRTGSAFLDTLNLTDQRRDFLEGTRLLPDPRLAPYLPPGMSATQASSSLANTATAFNNLAAHTMVRGAFNVNSTSVDAWKSMLSSMLRREGRKITDSTVENLSAPAAADDARFSRFRLPNHEAARSGTDSTDTAWSGPRDLTNGEIDALARAIVAEIRARGPFLSLAEFVNRRTGSATDPTSLRGALQAAIEKSGINSQMAADTGYQIDATKVSNLRFRTPEAATGPSGAGAPGMLTQADLLTVLGNTATVRADTFKIRAYGDARDASGRIVAKAWCEAVVQRLPDFVDPADAPETAINSLTSPSNSLFGRRFHMVSFRWLSNEEI